MPRVVLFPDLDEGHLFPTFTLAQSLLRKGHSVVFLVTADNVRYVKARGFPFRVIFADVYPEGTRQQYRKVQQAGNQKYFLPHIEPMLGGALDALMAELQPDLLLTSYFLPLEALLIHHKYHVNQAFFTPFLRKASESPRAECTQTILELEGTAPLEVFDFVAGNSDRQLIKISDLAEPLDDFHEFILCPRELDLPDNRLDSQRVHYINPSVREPGALPAGIELPEGKTILYASFGSQISLFRNEYVAFIRELIRAVAGPPHHWHVFISTGEVIEAAELGAAGENVTLLPWAPQVELLRVASAAIIHGGLGSVKECIHSAVPMIVVPMIRDQPDNARRVEYHRLGLSVAPGAVTASALHAALEKVLSDEEIKAGIRRMNQVFREAEASDAAVRLIEAIMHPD